PSHHSSAIYPFRRKYPFYEFGSLKALRAMLIFCPRLHPSGCLLQNHLRSPQTMTNRTTLIVLSGELRGQTGGSRTDDARPGGRPASTAQEGAPAYSSRGAPASTAQQGAPVQAPAVTGAPCSEI